ncbi:MAG: LysE family translocator [Parachlamydiaceae bacterium]|nr:LysE family translocator [Parachlamydiaceae bacterium]
MDLTFFVKGMILGFSVAAPVGPIGVLCIRKTLQYGRLSGFFSGLGAAAADTFYGIIAAFGLTFISGFLLAGQFWLRLFGGAFLVYLGLKTFYSKTEVTQTQVSHKTLLGDFVSTFFLTVTNPMTVVAYLAVFAGLGLADPSENYLNAFILVLGVFLGSALWWFILSEGITLFRHRISQDTMTWINRTAGSIIIVFGLLALYSTL